jgi:hypothetical protein
MAWRILTPDFYVGQNRNGRPNSASASSTTSTISGSRPSGDRTHVFGRPRRTQCRGCAHRPSRSPAHTVLDRLGILASEIDPPPATLAVFWVLRWKRPEPLLPRVVRPSMALLAGCVRSGPLPCGMCPSPSARPLSWTPGVRTNVRGPKRSRRRCLGDRLQDRQRADPYH